MRSAQRLKLYYIFTNNKCTLKIPKYYRGRRGRDRMVVGFTTT